jgi:exopolysaccharide biosynthesis polyprenyl glycosylphosphotransferase
MKTNIYRTFSSLTYQLIDFAIVTVSIWIAYKLYRISGIGESVIYQKVDIIPVSMSIGLFVIVIMRFFKVYQENSSVLNVEEIQNTTKGLTSAFLLIMVILVFGRVAISRYVIFFSYFISLTLIIGLKTYFYHVQSFSASLHKLNRKVLIYGAGELGQALYHEFSNSPKFGIIPVGFIDDNPLIIGRRISRSGFDTSNGINILGNRHDIKRLKESLSIDEIYIAISNIGAEALREIQNLLKRENIKWKFVPNLYKASMHKLRIEQIGQIPLVSEEESKSFYVPYVKPIFDILVSLIILIILSPIVLIIALLIRMDSKGPVIFRQDRVGKDGKVFEIYKFRTMDVDSNPYSVNPLDQNDPRITKIGKFLRKISFDEIPQLFNVLKGNMSLVGPRPEMPFIVEQYNEIQRERLRVLPGITGLWQLSGDRKKAIHENMDYDLYYIQNVSFFMDIAILIETLIFAFRGI